MTTLIALDYHMFTEDSLKKIYKEFKNQVAVHSYVTIDFHKNSLRIKFRK